MIMPTRYRRELNALCVGLDAKPSDKYLCYHTLTGRSARGEYHGYGHSAWMCSTGQDAHKRAVRGDHSVSLIAKDGSWQVLLAQPYLDHDDRYQSRYGWGQPLPDGVVAVPVGKAPYYPTSCTAFLVGAPDVVASLAPKARAVLAMARLNPELAAKQVPE